MTKFEQKSFSVGAIPSKQYRDNWDRIFAKPARGPGVRDGKEPEAAKPTPTEAAEESCCEHEDRPCPEGHRFCSCAYARCEHESKNPETGCDGICAAAQCPHTHSTEDKP